MFKFSSYKKFLAAFLAVMVTFTAFPNVPFLSPKAVQAAPADLNMYFYGTVQKGGENGNSPKFDLSDDPSRPDLGRNNQTVALEFNTPTDNNLYSMSFVDYFGSKIQLNAELDANDYFIIDYKTTGITTSSALIFHADNGGNYIPFADFITKQGTTPSTGESYVDWNLNGGAGHLRFFIHKQNLRGYSFKLGIHEVHLKWDGEKLSFAMDRFEPDRIYDVAFKASLGTTANVDKVKSFMTGVSKPTVANSVASYANDGRGDTKERAIDLSVEQTSLRPFITASVPMPKRWSNVSSSWVTLNNHEAAGSLGDITGVFVFNDNHMVPGAKKGFYAPINFLNPAGSIQPHAFENSGAEYGGMSWKVNPQLVGEQISFTLEGFPDTSGIYFNTEVIFETDVNKLKVKKTDFNDGEFYTVLRYSIGYNDGFYELSFKPYPGILGTYSIRMSGTAGSEPEPYTEIRIVSVDDTLKTQSAVVKPNLTHIYQIIFTPLSTTNKLKSQYAKHTRNVADIEAGTPRNFIVTDYDLNPISIDNLMEGILDIGFQWTIAPLDNLKVMTEGKSLDVEYWLNLRTDPKGDIAVQSVPFAKVKMTITRQGEDKYFVNYTYTVMEDGRTGSGSGELVGGVFNMRMKLPAHHVSISDNTRIIQYPNIYFLNVMLKHPTDVTKNRYSLDQSITLSDLTKPTVPPLQSFTADTPSFDPEEKLNPPSSFMVHWMIPKAKLSDYLRRNYLDENNIPTITKDEMGMGVYISTNEELMREFSNQRTTGTSTRPITIKDVEFADVFDGTKVDLTRLTIDVLRDPQTVLYIKNIPFDQKQFDELMWGTEPGASFKKDFLFKGLDSNQTYFMFADLTVKTENSPLTSLIGMTTLGPKPVPNPDEKVPQAVVLFNENISTDRATVFWEKIMPIDEDEVIEYEIIRLKDKPMPVGLFTSRLPFAEVFNHADLNTSNGFTDKIGFETRDGAKGTLHKFGASSFEGDPVDEKSFVYEEYSEKGNGGEKYFKRIIDKTLSPNVLYYYYARAVKILNKGTPNETRIYSTWSATSVTTQAVKQPLNLKVELDMPGYNPKTEFFISFDAPISNLDLLGKEYDLQYQIREDDGEWGDHVTMSADELKKSATKPSDPTLADYYHFIYKIKNLKPGKTYEIRVRLLSKSGDASLYTNIARYRTETEQTDYDISIDRDSWLKYLQEELEKLLKNPFWTIKDTDKDYDLLYRESMFDAVMKEATGSNIQLPTTSSNRGVYLLPLSNVLAAHDRNMGFTINFEGGEFVLPWGFINEMNEDLVLMKKLFNNGTIDDIFLKLTVTKHPCYDNINGETPLTDYFQLEAVLVGTSQSAKKLDDSIYKMLKKIIDDKVAAQMTIDEITKLVKNKATSEEFVQYVKGIVQATYKNFQGIIENEVNKTSKQTQSIRTLDKDVYIVATDIDKTQPAKGYKRSNQIMNNFEPTSVMDFGTGKAIPTKTTGTFIFTGFKLDYLQGIEYEKNIAEMISKYGLNSIIEENSPGNSYPLETPVTSRTVVACVARIAGAPEGTNYYEWLNKNMGINISPRNDTQPMSNAEIIELTMRLYEKRTKTPVSTVRITSFNSPSNISEYSDRFKPYVRAAYKLGICVDDPVKPLDTVTVNTFLNMLVKFVK